METSVVMETTKIGKINHAVWHDCSLSVIAECRNRCKDDVGVSLRCRLLRH